MLYLRRTLKLSSFLTLSSDSKYIFNNALESNEYMCLEPNLLKNETIEFVSKSHAFVPHFHIPLQSGSNELLKKMRRRYQKELYVVNLKINYDFEYKIDRLLFFNTF